MFVGVILFNGREGQPVEHIRMRLEVLRVLLSNFLK